MNYLEKGFLGNTAWWKYVVTLLMVFVGIGVFSIPHAIAVEKIKQSGSYDPGQFQDVSFLLTLFDPNVNIVYMILPFIGGLLFLMLGVKYVHRQKLHNLTTGRDAIDWKRVRFSFGIWSIFVVAFVGIQYIIAPESIVFNFQLKPFLILLVLAVVLVPIQTSFEEYLFRGYLMQSIAVMARNRWFPLLVTSVVFGLLHISNPEIATLGYGLLVYYIGSGFFLGIVALMDDGIELSLGFHAANNLISALVITADWQVFQTYSIFKDIATPNIYTAVLPALLLFPLMLYLFAKKYNWSDWKERLTGAVEVDQNTI